MNNLNHLKRAILDIILLLFLFILSVFVMSCGSNNSIKNQVESAETESIKSSISGSDEQIVHTKKL